MPTIPKLQHKRREPAHCDEKKLRLRRKVYDSRAWRTLRDLYLFDHPLCEECEKNGIINDADLTVHHRENFVEHGDKYYTYAYSYDNLMTLCRSCHNRLHLKNKNNDNI